MNKRLVVVWGKGTDSVGRSGFDYKKPQCKIRDPCDGNILNLDCINATTLVVRLYYSVARCYHGGKPFLQLI